MDNVERLLRSARPGTVVTDAHLDALREIESSNNPKAVNPKSGAMGAYQFMPGTVAQLAKQGIKFDPFDEPQAREAARQHLQDFVDRSGGDLNKGLALYGGHVTKSPTDYINKFNAALARQEKSQAQTSESVQDTGPEDNVMRLLRSAKNAEPSKTQPDKQELAKPAPTAEANRIREIYRNRLGAPSEPSEPTAPAASDQIPATTVAPQPATPKTEFKVGSMADLGKGIVSMADVAANQITGLVGYAGYPIIRAGTGAAGAPAEVAQKIVSGFTEATANPIGRALGITEDPAYKAEASRRLMDFIGENIGKGAQWISQKTGLPVSDVENMIGSGMLATGPAAARLGTKAGATAYGAEQALRDQFAAKAPAPRVEPGIGAPAPAAPAPGQPKPRVTYAELQAQLEAKRAAQGVTPESAAPAQTVTPAQQAQAPIESGAGLAASRGSVGAAAVTDLSAINAAFSQASPELQAQFRKVPREQINLQALESHLQAERLGLGSDYFTKGQATQDHRIISNEQNLRGKHEALSEKFNQQDPKLRSAMDRIHDRAIQNEAGGSMFDHGEKIIKEYTEIDKARTADINKKYQALRDAAGGNFPIDAQQVVQNAKMLLKDNLKTEFLPSAIEKQLSLFEAGEPMTFEKFEALRTNIAAEMRKAEQAGDGNATFALSLARQAIEDVPLLPEARNLKAIADQARSAAKERFTALRADPAYEAAVNDAVPDTFVKKHILNSNAGQVRLMRDTFGENSTGALNVESALINHLRERGGLIEKSKISQANYNKAFRELEEKIKAGAKPETVEDLRTLGDVLYKTQAQPTGSFVNNSNTFVASVAEQGVNKAAQAADIKLMLHGMPPVASQAMGWAGKKRAEFQVKRNIERGAGIKRD